MDRASLAARFLADRPLSFYYPSTGVAMAARQSTILLALVGGLLLAGALALLLWPEEKRKASGTAVATLASSFNDVRSRPARSMEWKPAARGMPLFTQDAVRTLVQSRAVISYGVGLILNVDPESLVIIAAPPEPGGVQEVQVAEGTVAGELLPGASSPSAVRILGPGGIEARLVRKDSKEALRYRIRVGEGGKAEVAILAGSASLETRGGVVQDVAAGQAVDLTHAGAGSAVRLPDFPESLSPEVDEQVRIASGPAEVALRWNRPERAARFRVQIGKSFSFDAPLVDHRTDMESEIFVPPGLETYFWRVSSLDAEGRESEFGFVRRFAVALLPPPGSEDVAVEKPLDLRARLRGGRVMRQAVGQWPLAPLRGEVALGAGDTLLTDRGGALAAGGAIIELAEGSKVRVEKTGLRPNGGKVIAFRLLEGETTVQLKKGAELAEAALFAGAGLATAQATDGPRLRAELTGETARFVTEAGVAAVRAGASRLSLNAGWSVEVLPTGALTSPIALPRPPQIAGPDDGAVLYALDSPPRVELRWAPSDGAVRYRLTLGRGDPFDLVASELTPRLTFAHNALKPGSYSWSVAAVDEQGRRGAASVLRGFKVEKDTTPPEVTVSAPDRVSGADVTVNGRTEAGARIKINGRAVDLSKSGSFAARVPLARGPNQLVVEALDRAGNVTYKVLRVRRE